MTRAQLAPQFGNALVSGVVGFLIGGLTTFGLVQGRLAALEVRAAATETALQQLRTDVRAFTGAHVAARGAP